LKIETDQLARALARLIGKSMTKAITAALRERARRAADKDLPARLAVLSQELRAAYDTRPVSRTEWDAACSEVS
jgi:hypothetical protein